MGPGKSASCAKKRETRLSSIESQPKKVVVVVVVVVVVFVIIIPLKVWSKSGQ